MPLFLAARYHGCSQARLDLPGGSQDGWSSWPQLEPLPRLHSWPVPSLFGPRRRRRRSFLMSSSGAQDDYLRNVLVHGLRPAWVVVVDYDDGWPARYEQYAARLREVLGDRLLLIEHIGSTSVRGLAAKPVIDIVIGVVDPDDEPSYVPDLESEGYDMRVREPGHRALRGGETAAPVNLHCYQPDAAEVRRYLALRDRLRLDPVDRDRYAAAKRALADREWPDMNYYAEAKSPIIEEILRHSDLGD